MSTQMQGKTADLTEHEFAKPCATLDCDETASWLGWASHGIISCPAEAYVCDKCRRDAIAWWEEVLQIPGEWCFLCGHSFQGQLSDNLKVIHL